MSAASSAARAVVPLAALAGAVTTGCMPRELDLKDLDVGRLNQVPLVFLRQEVEVVGDIEDVFATRAFTIEDPGVFDDREVLVVAQPGVVPAGYTPQKDQKVLVRGEVRQYVVDELIADFPELGLESLAGAIRFEWAAPVIIVHEALWL